MTKNFEYLDIVDEDDKVIDKKTYEECHEKGLLHRSVQIEIYRDETNSQILILRRSKNKKQSPELLEIPGGHVRSGETYGEAAARELQEELGLTTPLTEIAKEKNESGNPESGIVNRELVRVFKGIWQGRATDLKLNKHDATEAEWQSVNKVVMLAKNAPTLVNSATRLFARRQFKSSSRS